MEVFLILLVFVLNSCEAVFIVNIFLPGNTPSPPVVNVIEGRNLTLNCLPIRPGFAVDATVIWTKSGSTEFHFTGTNLTIPKVRDHDAGVYECFATRVAFRNNQASAKVNVTVLYGPRHLAIEGPVSASASEFGRIFLRCTAEGNPKPTIWWSNTADGSAVIHKGSNFTSTFQLGQAVIYCFAENTLVPTKGESETLRAYIGSNSVVQGTGNVTTTVAPVVPVTRDTCSTVMLVSLVIGWSVVGILLLIGLFFCVRHRKSAAHVTIKGSDHETTSSIVRNQYDIPEGSDGYLRPVSYQGDPDRYTRIYNSITNSDSTNAYEYVSARIQN